MKLTDFKHPILVRLKSQIIDHPKAIPTIGLLIALCYGYYIFFVLTAFGPGEYARDFGIFYRATQAAFAGYSPYEFEVVNPYRYSPVSTFSFYLQSKVEVAKAWNIQRVILATLWTASIIFGARLFRWKKWDQIGYLILGIIAGHRGAFSLIYTGQIDIYLLFFLVLASITYLRYPIASGASLAILPFFKAPWALPMLPFLRQEWSQKFAQKRLTYSLITVCFLFLVFPILMFGFSNASTWTWTWIRNFWIGQPHLFWIPDNTGLIATIVKLLYRKLSITSYFWMIGSLLLFPISFYFFVQTEKRNLNPPNIQHPFSWIGKWILLLMLVNPLGWRWVSALWVFLPWSIAKGSLIPKKIRWITFLGFIALVSIEQLAVTFQIGSPILDLIRVEGFYTFATSLLFLLVI